MSTPTGNTDPYVYPGTSVLKNLRGIRDSSVLSRFEMDMTSRRLAQLAQSELSGLFDASRLRTIHACIFQDVYPWAGDYRTVSISLPGVTFAFHEFIATSLDQVFDALSDRLWAREPDLRRFAMNGAFLMGEINAVHPFRDGNGRAQREFIRQLAVHHGHSLNWSRVSMQQMYEASSLSFRRQDYSGLEEIIYSAISE